MSRKKGLNDEKVMYRLQHFKDFQNVLITVNGGTIVATTAYLSTFSVEMKERTYALAGIAFLGVSIFAHILILFINYLLLGLIYDRDDETAKNIGKSVLVPLILTSLGLTPLGFLSIFIFLVKNL